MKPETTESWVGAGSQMGMLVEYVRTVVRNLSRVLGGRCPYRKPKTAGEELRIG